MDALPARASPAAESPALPEEPGPQVRELEVERDVHAFHGGNEALSVVIDKSPNHCYIKVRAAPQRARSGCAGPLDVPITGSKQQGRLGFCFEASWVKLRSD